MLEAYFAIKIIHIVLSVMFPNVPVPAYLCIWYDLVNHFRDTQNYYVGLIIDLEANTLIITTLKIKTNVFLGDNLSTVFHNQLKIF